LEQREGRAIRKGNEIAKLYADNKVDVIIYAVEKSLDSYKFNLLHNKQLFISQLKTNNMGSRRIDEGSMDEQSGMNFSEYVAILSGNTDLLDKVRLEKKIAALESERKNFNLNKSATEHKLENIIRTIDGNNELISRMKDDYQTFMSCVQYGNDGSKLNPLKLNGVESADVKVLAAKLKELDDKSATNGEHYKIGELYGFKLLVKTEESAKEASGLFEGMKQNMFSIEGEGNVKYKYNNGRIANDPKLAVTYFIRALEAIPTLIENHEKKGEKLSADIPVLKEIAQSTWRKEEELKNLKTEFAALDRKIQLSLKPIDESEDKPEKKQEKQDYTPQNSDIQRNGNTNPFSSSERINGYKNVMGDRLIIASVPKFDDEKQVKGIKM
jgi:hypothetical protein